MNIQGALQRQILMKIALCTKCRRRAPNPPSRYAVQEKLAPCDRFCRSCKVRFRCKSTVIGASAGGIAALGQILPLLPSSYPIPLVIVLHIPSDSQSLLPGIFASKVHLNVKEADEKESIRPGTIYFAPPGYHLLLERNGTLSLSLEPPVHFSRPSIDVLFETAADAYGKNLVGVLLTGANEDGAGGIQKIESMGGIVLIQDPARAQMPTMPASAIRGGLREHVLSLAELGEFLLKLNQSNF